MALRRKFYAGRDWRRAITIEDLRAMAHRRTPTIAIEYVEGGAETEATLRRNRAVLESIRFVPSTLVDTTSRHQRVSLFGRESPSPLVIAPTGLNGLLRRGGDIMLARAAAAAGIPFTLSTVSNARLEHVAEQAGGHLWMQLYVLKNRDMVRDIVARADRAGYEALVFTSDANVFGNREWDRRNYVASAKPTWRNRLDILMHPRWLFDVIVPHGFPRFENIIDFIPPKYQAARAGVRFIPSLFAPAICWEDVARLREAWPRKLLVKGVLSVADAKRAAGLGCDGIVLTNHGGRQLDSCVSAIEMLPDIKRAVGEKLTVIVDGGFRRGNDVVKAMALGADAVMIGRATLYGLAAGGEGGVTQALTILTGEIDRVLGQLGCRSFADVGPHLLAGDHASGTVPNAPAERVDGVFEALR